MSTKDDNKILRSYRLPKDLIEELERVAKNTGIDKTALIEEAIAMLIENGLETRSDRLLRKKLGNKGKDK